MRTQQPSMYSTEVCSVLSALDKLCIGGHWVPLCHSIAVIGSKILVGWDSNSPHIMIVQPRTYIYIHTHTPHGSRNHTTNLDFLRTYPYIIMVLPKQEKHQCSFWQNSNQAHSSQLSFLMTDQHTNFAVLAENLSVMPPTPPTFVLSQTRHVWSLRPMVLCLNRAGKRSEIYNLHAAESVFFWWC